LIIVNFEKAKTILKKRYAELLLSTTNSSIIKAVVIFAEKIFQNESFVW